MSKNKNKKNLRYYTIRTVNPKTVLFAFKIIHKHLYLYQNDAYDDIL